MRALFVVLALAGCDQVFTLTAPPDDHDEDADRIGDPDDNCPGIANKQSQDTDQDGVGDACDPRPGTGGDHIAVFYGFGDTSQPDWVRRGGSWAFSNDQLVYQPGTDYERMIAENGMSFTPTFVIEAQYHIDAMPAGGEISLMFAYESSSSGFFCTLRRTSAGFEVDAYSPGQDSITKIPTLDLTATFNARFTIGPDEITCDIKSDREPGRAATAQAGQARTGAVGFESKLTGARIDYMTVYTRD